MKLGAHVSTSGGLDKAIDRGVEIGCETIQIFGSAPQAWAYKTPPAEVTDAFREKARDNGIGPVFFHGIYLINLGSADPNLVEKGIGSLINYMHLAAEIDAGGVIFHPGSHKGAGYEGILERTVAAIERVLENSPEGPYLTLENTAGMGQHIGAKLEELGRIIRNVDEAHRHRLRICLDTQHSYAAGYDVATKDGLEAMMAEFDETIGLDKLAAIHANDSKYTLGGWRGPPREHRPGVHRPRRLREHRSQSRLQGCSLLPGGAGDGGQGAGQGKPGHPQGYAGQVRP